MDDIEILRQLAQLGDEKAKAEADRHQVMLKITNLAPKAVAAGITKAEIARRTKLSEPTVYAMFDD